MIEIKNYGTAKYVSLDKTLVDVNIEIPKYGWIVTTVNIETPEDLPHVLDIVEYLKTITIEPYVPNIEMIVERKKTELTHAMRLELSNGFKCFNGIVMQSEQEHVDKLTQGLNIAKSIGKDTMNIRDINNDMHMDTPVSDVESMVNELSLNWYSIWDKKCSLHDMVTSIAKDPDKTDMEKAVEISEISWAN